VDKKNKTPVDTNVPESPSKRKFIKKAAIGIALLPYVAPLIESFTLRNADAWDFKCPPKGRGKISPVGY